MPTVEPSKKPSHKPHSCPNSVFEQKKSEFSYNGNETLPKPLKPM